MIVKIQLSQYPYNQECLIYNKNRSYFVETEITADILNLMGDKQKAYFETTLSSRNTLLILHEVEKQNW